MVDPQPCGWHRAGGATTIDATRRRRGVFALVTLPLLASSMATSPHLRANATVDGDANRR
jgi:hypothetical protein